MSRVVLFGYRFSISSSLISILYGRVLCTDSKCYRKHTKGKRWRATHSSSYIHIQGMCVRAHSMSKSCVSV
uniref:Putative secreted peptide n=1 Tax=Anopheles braziliensis TaxID=58242 RepID=A0A2M3ZX18_9DIPT